MPAIAEVGEQNLLSNYRLSLGLSLFISLSTLSAAETDPKAKTFTLTSLFQRSLQVSESVQAREQILKQSEARYRQALGSLLPTINGVGSYTWQDDAPTTSASSGNQGQIRLSGTQPLLKGFREYFGLREASRLLRAQKANEQAANLDLFESIAMSFFSNLSLKQELSFIDQQTDAVQKRVSALENRVKIGRSKRTDFLASQVALENLIAQRERLKAEARAERIQLESLVQLDPDMYFIEDDVQLPSSLPSAATLLQKLSENPSFQAKRFEAEAAAEARKGAWGLHLPNVDLTGNYYLHREGILKDLNWDLKLEVVIPLFSGGVTHQKVREAQAKEQQTEWDRQKRLRELQTQARRQLEILQGNFDEVKALTKAAQTAAANTRQQMKDYELGLVDNLDVLTALNTEADTKRSLTKAEASSKLNWTRLQLLTGAYAGMMK